MKITKTYLYFGENGTFTSPVLIPGAPSLTYLNLQADEGKILTDGTRKVPNIVVLENNADKWTEIDNTDEKG